ncbi:MAG: DHH family phosphoesterase [Candidatus Ancaeobacter aquaticus]|nr:DHH family phosphoesterase [Candidatus Ancaeobacter aquaticus]
MQGLQKAAQMIRKAKTIMVACHINPDGDTIGSLLSLGLALEKIGKRVHFISQDGVPHRFRCLPGARRIKKKLLKKVDLAISVDCNCPEMLGKPFDSVMIADQVLEIDHHEYRRPYGDFALVDLKVSSVGELIYMLLKKLNIKITCDIAQNILTSIIVETNSFSLPTTNSSTFRVSAELLETGLDFYKLTDMVYWSRTREVALLSGICLARCAFLKCGKIAWSIVRAEDFKRIKGKDEDVDAVADEMRSIKGVKISVLFREKGRGLLRVSLRSKGKINVAHLAELFGGGGHADVAGCYISNRPSLIQNLLKQAAKLVR